MEYVVSFELEHRVLGQIDAIGVGEIQYAKGHKYLKLVCQIDLGITRLLWVGRIRAIESFQGFFATIGDEVAIEDRLRLLRYVGTLSERLSTRNAPRLSTFSTDSTLSRK